MMITQFTTYTEIRGRFSKHLWIDVVSKCDILHESPSAFITEDLTTDDADLARYRIFGPEGAMRVSVMNGHGLDEVCTESVLYLIGFVYTNKMVLIYQLLEEILLILSFFMLLSFPGLYFFYKSCYILLMDSQWRLFYLFIAAEGKGS